MNKVVLLCRPGFGKECAAEITDKAGQREIFRFCPRERRMRLCHL